MFIILPGAECAKRLDPVLPELYESPGLARPPTTKTLIVVTPADKRVLAPVLPESGHSPGPNTAGLASAAAPGSWLRGRSEGRPSALRRPNARPPFHCPQGRPGFQSCAAEPRAPVRTRPLPPRYSRLGSSASARPRLGSPPQTCTRRLLKRESRRWFRGAPLALGCQGFGWWGVGPEASPV